MNEYIKKADDSKVIRLSRQRTDNKVVKITRSKNISIVHISACLLAAGVLDFWLETQKHPLACEKAVKFLGIKIKADEFSENEENKFDIFKSLKKVSSKEVGDVFGELKIRLEDLGESLSVDVNSSDSLSSFFECAEDYLERWYMASSRSEGFTSCSVTLRSNSRQLRAELNQRFEQIALYRNQGQGSVRASLELLRELEAFFSALQHKYQQKSQRFFQKENGCLQTYQRHLDQIKRKKKIDNREWHYYVTKQALSNRYKFRIKGEIYSLAAQAVKNMAMTNELHLSILEECQRFLRTLRDNLLEEARGGQQDNILWSPVAGKVSNYVNPDNLREEVEKKLGHSLLAWGRYEGITSVKVKKVLLEELNPIAQKICSNMYEHFNQEFNIDKYAREKK